MNSCFQLYFATLSLVTLWSWCVMCDDQASEFVSTDGSNFMLNGEKWRFAGTNCYYLTYQSKFMVDDVMNTAAKQGFEVIRIWGFIDIGYPDGSECADSNYPLKNGLYFQYYDDSIKGPNYNNTDLIHLDYVLYKAKQLGLKILITLTNNWSDFGGMDQYIIWKQLSDSSYTNPYHDDFYSDNQIKEWYKNWLNYLINRINTYTKISYKNDPTIFSWELANEPRCQGTGNFGTSNNCTLNYAAYNIQPIAYKLTKWLEEMSTYLKSIDNNHIIGTGDEGWFCYIMQASSGSADYDCYFGVDTIKFIQIENINYMTIHLYPDQWGQTNEWANLWIENHTKIAYNNNKPILLGEFGATNSNGMDQHQVYKQWTDTVFNNGTNGDLFWMISGREDPSANNGYWVQNYDGYAVYCPNATQPASPGVDNATCQTLSNHAHNMKNDK